MIDRASTIVGVMIAQIRQLVIYFLLQVRILSDTPFFYQQPILYDTEGVIKL